MKHEIQDEFESQEVDLACRKLPLSSVALGMDHKTWEIAY